MSKNFVREIDSIKNINKQEFYTNKANDLLSTKEHNYIRKETREYHCLTDNVKQTKASNVKYTDTTARPNVNYNLISVDNSQVPKTNTNTISASSLVSALEAKDQQLKEMKDEIAKLNPERKSESLDAVLYTSTGGRNGAIDGFITAKTVCLLNETETEKEFIADFIFYGKLERSNDGTDYHTSISFKILQGLWADLKTFKVKLEQFMTFDPMVFNNGLECPTYTSGPSGNKLAFFNNGTQTEDTISTSTTFTLKVIVRKK